MKSPRTRASILAMAMATIARSAGPLLSSPTMRNRATSLFVAAALICLIPLAGQATVSPYSQDFEFLIQTDPDALANDGWQVSGNVFEPDGTTFLYPYGPFPAPNNGLAFCQIDLGQGGAEQGFQQLVVFSDYENTDHAMGNIIESNMFQEQVIGLDNVGETWIFEYQAKLGDIEPNSTAAAFIKIFEPAPSFALVDFISMDMTSIPVSWGGYSVSVTIGPSWVGYILQFGFLNRATNYEGSGIFYDNVVFYLPDFRAVLSGPLTDSGNTDGAAWGDYDGDGDEDLYLSNRGQPNKLLRKDGPEDFVDVTTAPLDDSGDGSGVAWGDYDNDGDLDLYLGNSNTANKLFRNDGGGVFTALTGGLLGYTGDTRDVAWGDYDNDGDLDLYVVNAASESNLLLRNDGEDQFADAGISLLGDTGDGMAASWADYDADGDLDLYLCNHSTLNSRLFRNDGGSFSDVTAGDLSNGRLGQGIAWGDYDNDQDLDLFICNDTDGERLLRNDNDGSDTFVDVTSDPLDAIGTAMSAAWGDYDNDGDLDLYVAVAGDRNKLFVNDGAGGFSDGTDFPIDEAGNGRGAAWADHDADGDLDLYLCNDGPNWLFLNQVDNGNHWLQADLIGLVSNRSGIGAHVRIDGGVTIQTQELSGGSGLHSQGSLTAEFGLGAATAADVTVLWPSGAVRTLTQVSADQRLRIVESSLSPLVVNGLPVSFDGDADWGDYDEDGDLDLALTGELDGLPASRVYTNTGSAFTDLGVGLADATGGNVDWGDYDGDGDLDLLLTGTDGSAGVLEVYLNDAGSFASASPAPLISSLTEGQAAAWGDYDNDGDLDILFTGHDGYGPMVRLLANGDLGFSAVYQPDLVAVDDGCLAWGDYDADGDLDVLVAGLDGVGAASNLYRNDAARFVDSGVALTGISDGSVDWGDYDADGDLDILLCGNDGSVPVSFVYRNDTGSFVDIGAGLEGVSGGAAKWADWDADGDLDILLSGTASGGDFSAIYWNDDWNGTRTFRECRDMLPDLGQSIAAWGDTDGDNNLDLFVSGSAASADALLQRNDLWATNTAPTDAPTNLRATWDGTEVTFSWDAAGDTAAALTYNLRVGTSLGAGDIVPSMSDELTGLRRVARPGNVGANLTWSLALAGFSEMDGIYWSVQAVDGVYAGSPFATKEFLQPPFRLVDAGLPGAADGDADWGDYDGDEDLDLLLTGWTGSERMASVFRNDGGAFVDIAAGLTPVDAADAEWGDYDNDGDLDLVICGRSIADELTRIYRNDGGTFAAAGAGLPGVQDGSVDWGDYDHDGDLDLLLVGWFLDTGANPDTTGMLSVVYRNDAGSFVDAGLVMPGMDLGQGSWFDYETDGDLDVLLSGWTGAAQETHLYRNDLVPTGTLTFVEHPASPIMDIEDAHMAWGHYDADGEVDLLLTGWDATGPVTKIYNQQAGVFTEQTVSLPDVTSGSSAWADYDNDGAMDILLAGWTDAGPVTQVFRANGADYEEVGVGLPGVYAGSVNWVDFDVDGDLDLLVAGWGSQGATTRLYRNDVSSPNTDPNPPASPSHSFVGDVLTFQWSPGSDMETAVSGLTYNLRVGTTSGGSEIVSAMADPATGFRRVSGFGNAGPLLQWSIDYADLSGATDVYWSVQCVDEAFAGSSFADELDWTYQGAVVAVEDPGLPDQFALQGNYPNPFNPSTVIAFDLPRPEVVELAIFDVRGRLVRQLAEKKPLPAGHHKIRWDGTGHRNTPVSSGVYLYRLSAGSFVAGGRMTLVR